MNFRQDAPRLYPSTIRTNTPLLLNDDINDLTAYSLRQALDSFGWINFSVPIGT